MSILTNDTDFTARTTKSTLLELAGMDKLIARPLNMREVRDSGPKPGQG